ncbi:MAG: cation:proton antiporter [Candidatus Uhrbacteria bacterium]
MPTDILAQFGAIFGVAIAVAFIVRLLRQPLLVAYLIAGIICGPFVLNFLRGDESLFRTFADLGVVLLLFAVGLNLNVRHLRDIGRSSIITGIGQFLFTAIIGFAILLPFPMPWLARAYLAIAITFSSTIVIVKLLSDKGHSERLYGRHTIGLMIVQDIIAIVLLFVLSAFNADDLTAATVATFFLRTVAVLVVVVGLARFILPRLVPTAARSGEHLFLLTVAWCFGVASIVHAAGFSLEIGAIVAGASLAMSPYQPEIASRVRPLRDFFLVLFFVILGSQMQLTASWSAIGIGAILSLFIIIGNPLILYALYRRLGFTRRNSFLAGLTAAQVSEFGFVIIAMGLNFGHLRDDELSIFTMTALLTFMVSTYLITYNEQLFRLFQPLLAKFGHERPQTEDPNEHYDAWLFGYHRIGWKVADGLGAKNIRAAIVDDNPAVTEKLRARGMPVFFGDASDVEFLESLPLDGAKIIISTIPDSDTQLVLIKYLRQHLKSRSRIIATAEHVKQLDALYAAGADFVTMPHLLGGVWLSEVLTEKPWTAATFKQFRDEQHKELQLRIVAATQA